MGGKHLRCFDYPFDPAFILQKKRALRRELLASEGLVPKKVAILSGSTVGEIKNILELFLLNAGIRPEFYVGGYALFYEELTFDADGALAAFAPDIIYVHTSARNLGNLPLQTDTPEQAEEKFAAECARWQGMWKAAARFGCPVVQNNFELPGLRVMGSMDAVDPHGRVRFVNRMNAMLADWAAATPNFYLHDLCWLSASVGVDSWCAPAAWYAYKYALDMQYIPLLCHSVANIIKSLYGRNKKALVLDLDNTLWGGIVGDDGVDGLAIGPEVPEGQVYAEFQSYCKALKSIGVILAVDSKNDEANALAGLNHPDGVLRPNDFVAIKANWDPKDLNLKAIASELNLGADSFVFADDNPAERAIVAAQVPGVAVPALDGAENYIKTLDHGGYFEVTALSKEDLKKTELYHQNAERAKAQAAFADYGQYLDSLEMTATIKGFEPVYIQRIAQLTNKSNQFNLTTLRCSEDDIRAMAGDKNDLCLCGKLVDKFGDNGIVTVVAGRQQGDVLDLTLWLMSCRVLKRGMEDAMMDTVVAEAAARGVKTIVGHYYPTAKNAMVREFYAQYDFAKTAEDADGNTEWTLDVAAYTPKHPHMKIER